MTTSDTVAGLDIYHGDEAIDFHAAHEAGVAYCFIKATQGLAVNDSRFELNRDAAKAAGILAGAYHFFDPNEAAVLQAHHFIDIAKPASGELVPALDIEVGGENVGLRARVCADEIKNLTGHCPIIYSSDSFFRQYLAPHFVDFPLWIARYGTPPSTTCTFWQNSDSAHLPGTTHALDRDIFLGTPADLQKFLLS